MPLPPHETLDGPTNISLNPEALSSTLVLHGIGWSAVGLNTVLFARRQNLAQ